MHHKVLSHSLAATLMLGLAAPAWSQDNSKAIIEKAIQAQGGADKLAKAKVTHEKSKGIIYFDGMEIPFKAETYQQLPNQFKNTVSLNAMGMEVTIIQALNGDKGWSGFNGKIKDADDKEFAALKEELHASNVTALLPLLNDKGFELKVLGETQVDNKVAVGVQVSFKGRHDIKLYFDKDNGLLVKVTRPGQDPLEKPVTQEEFYSDYKVVEGVKQPHRVVVHQDGKKFMEVDYLQFNFAPSFDAKIFARPQ
jgi:hypothetical protein